MVSFDAFFSGVIAYHAEDLFEVGIDCYSNLCVDNWHVRTHLDKFYIKELDMPKRTRLWCVPTFLINL